MIYGEVTTEGYLIEISYTKPAQRSTVHTIVELVAMPSADLQGKPLAYDAATKTAIVNEGEYAVQLESEKKEEILELLRRQSQINEAVSQYGLDYTTELALIAIRLSELTA